MNRHSVRKWLSLVLCLSMMLTILPVTARAEEIQPDSGVKLAEGNYASWMARLDTDGVEYASDFAAWLTEYGALALANPADEENANRGVTVLEDGSVVYALLSETGSVEFTYDPLATEAEIAAAAQAAVDAVLSQQKLDEVTAWTEAIYGAYRMDHPEVFWLTGKSLVDADVSISSEYEEGSGIAGYERYIYFVLSTEGFDVRAEKYQNVAALEEKRDRLNTNVAECVADFTQNTNVNEQVFQAHEWLIKANEYNSSEDLSAIDHDCREAVSALAGSRYNHGSYGDDGPLSEGYAKGFKVLCDAMGIPCVLVVGTAGDKNHMWNLVQMEDGVWYAVDVTWDDPLNSKKSRLDYFLVGSDSVVDDAAFAESHEMTNVLSEGGVAFVNGPELSERPYLKVYVNGQPVEDIDEGDDTISWNAENKTLTLSNAAIGGEKGTYKGAGIYVTGPDAIVIELEGENSVTGVYQTDNVFCSAALSVDNGLTIRGDGSLNATVTLPEGTSNNWREDAGIFSGGDTFFEGGTITATGLGLNRSHGIILGDEHALSRFEVSDGTINASAGSTGEESGNIGMLCYGQLELSGGSVTGQGGTEGFGFCDYSSSNAVNGLILSGGTITASGGEMAVSTGIVFRTNYVWTNEEGGTLNVTGTPNWLESTYLYARPGDYRIGQQPCADNDYVIMVEQNFDGIWGDVNPEYSVSYQWNKCTSKEVVAGEAGEDQISANLTFNEEEPVCEDGVWKIPAEQLIFFLIPARAGDQLNMRVDDPDSVFAVLNYATETLLSHIDGVYSLNITEADLILLGEEGDPILPEAPVTEGYLMIAMLTYKDIEAEMEMVRFDQVENLSQIPNRLDVDDNGTFNCVVRVNNTEGVPEAVLISDAFAYTCDHPRAKYTDNISDHTMDCSCGTYVEHQPHAYVDDVCVCGSSLHLLSLEYVDDDGNAVSESSVVTKGEALSLDLPELTGYETKNGTYTFDHWQILIGGEDAAEIPALMPPTYVLIRAVYRCTGWDISDEGVRYLLENEPLYGWQYIEEDYDDVAGGAWYYFHGETGFRAEGLSRASYPTEAINGNTYAPDQETLDYCAGKGIEFIDAEEAWFVFDEDGKFQSDLNGFCGTDKWAVNGMLTWHPGLVESDGAYYYFIGDTEKGGNILVNGFVNVTHTNGVVEEAGVYYFDSQTNELCAYTGIQEVEGELYYFTEGYRLAEGAGLVKVEDDYIYVRSNGKLVVNAEYYVPANELGIVEGMYQFDENGMMIIPEVDPVKDGIYWENDAWFYYQDGVLAYGLGLVEITEVWHDGETETGTEMTGIVYVRSNGSLAQGSYYVTNVDNYTGSLDIPSGTKLRFSNYGTLVYYNHGIVAENESLYYYQYNELVYGAGLIEIDGSYYYVRSNGEVVHDRYYWITNTNDTGVAAKNYYFDSEGVLQNPEMVADQRNGIVEVDGVLYYYENGTPACGAGLVVLEEGVIYVRSNGALAVGKYWVTNTAGTGYPQGYYTFGADGIYHF